MEKGNDCRTICTLPPPTEEPRLAEKPLTNYQRRTIQSAYKRGFMTELFPNYYKKFKCIADKCRHSCCIGWEVDIDEDTADYYRSLDGDFAERIRGSLEGEPPHFSMREDGRCPFLNEKGLCDIIVELGEEALCDICFLHPRFSNVYDDFCETGLGLCCEEAVRVILTEKEKFSLPLPQGVQEEAFFKKRQRAFDILQNRSITALERFKMLAGEYNFGFAFANEELYRLYMSLERLDVVWENELEKLKISDGTEIFEREDLQLLFEQLACYFTFRHFGNGVGFILVSLWVLGMIFSHCESIDEIFDAVRMYSSEIEYSRENTEFVEEYVKKMEI